MPRTAAPRLVRIAPTLEMAVTAHSFSAFPVIRQSQKLKSLSHYTQQHPTGWIKRLDLGNLHYEMGNWDAAIAEYQQVLLRKPQLFEVRLRLGKLLQFCGKTLAAIALYQDAIPNASHPALVCHLQGLIAQTQRHYPQALANLEQAIALMPQSPIHWLALAEIHLELGQPFSAMAAYDKILAIAPQNPIILGKLHDLSWAVGQYELAEKTLQQLIDLAPQSFETLRRIIYRDCQRGQVTGEASRSLQKSLKALHQIASDIALPYTLQAQYHLLQGNDQQGLQILKDFVEQHPHQPDGWYGYVYGLLQTGRYSCAAQTLLTMLDRFPKQRATYEAIGEILPLAGMKQELYPKITNMVEDYGHCWTIWAIAGRVLVTTFQEIEQGCRYARRATILQPQLGDAWFCYGRVLAIAGQIPEAIAALEQGWQCLPQASEAMTVAAAVWLGECYQRVGNQSLSHQWGQTAQQRSQNLAPFQPALADYWQGRAWEGLGKVQEAIAAYQSALQRQIPYPQRSEVTLACQTLNPDAWLPVPNLNVGESITEKSYRL